MSSTANSPHILCVSWEQTLSVTRELLFTTNGYKVTSALGEQQSMDLCSTKADLLVLGHSVPREQKQKILECFRKFNTSPALSLLTPRGERLPNVEYAAQALDPIGVLEIVRQILPSKPR